MHATSPDVLEGMVAIPRRLLYQAGATIDDLRVYDQCRAADVHGSGLCQTSYRKIAKALERKPTHVGRNLRRLETFGVLERVYDGTWHAGDTRGEANTYRMPDGVPHGTPSETSAGLRDGDRGGTPSLPLRGKGPRARPKKAKGGRSAHPAPCYCDECMVKLEALTEPDRTPTTDRPTIAKPVEVAAAWAALRWQYRGKAETVERVDVASLVADTLPAAARTRGGA